MSPQEVYAAVQAQTRETYSQGSLDPASVARGR
jgi:hypothetical protein